MADEPTINIKLNQPVYDLEGNPQMNRDRLREIPECLDMTDEKYFLWAKSHTTKELLDLTPKTTLGESLIHILNNCIKADDNAKAAELFGFIHKINSKKLTKDGDWKLTKDELRKFIDLIKTAKQNLNPIVNGQVDVILEEYMAEIVNKSLPEKIQKK